MNALPDIEPHDAAWAPNGRAADVPIADGGEPNPLAPPLAPDIDARPAPCHTDIATHKVGITFFTNEYASSLTAKGMTLPELSDLIGDQGCDQGLPAMAEGRAVRRQAQRRR